jgi:ribosomal protein S18 acetylase RimI-like enzyme
MYTLRPTRDEDFDFLFDLHEATMRPYVETIWGWDPADQRERLRRACAEQPRSIVIIAGADNGVVQIESLPDCVYLGLIEIHPRVQRLGIGAAIVRRVIEQATARGVPAKLRVFKINIGARRLYQRLGFVIVGESETHYDMRYG